MLRWIDRLAKWWMKKRGIYTVSGGVFTIPENSVVNTLIVEGGTVCNRYEVPLTSFVAGTPQQESSPSQPG